MAFALNNPRRKQINKKKRTCPQVIYAVQADQWVTIEESEKMDKYLDLAKELEKYPARTLKRDRET